MTAAPAEGGSREPGDVDALVTDQYLESILAAHARGADAGPLPVGTRPAPDIRMAAERLARDLPRLHPSFRFEEALAGKLAEAATGMRLPLAAGGDGGFVPLVGRRHFEGENDANDDNHDRLVLRTEARPTIGRPLIIGGALTSAALSIAGAVYVAWRIRHPQSSPMARAVRAVARTRLA